LVAPIFFELVFSCSLHSTDGLCLYLRKLNTIFLLILERVASCDPTSPSRLFDHRNYELHHFSPSFGETYKIILGWSSHNKFGTLPCKTYPIKVNRFFLYIKGIWVFLRYLSVTRLKAFYKKEPGYWHTTSAICTWFW
jgi:hypothetical protein